MMYDAPAAPTVLRQVMLETTASRIAVAIALPALAGCGDSTRSSDYFPLTPGSQWQYRIERTTMDGTGQLRYLIKVEVPTPDSSADLRSRVTFDGQRFQYKLADEGIYRIGVQRVQQPTLAADSQPQMVLPSKLVLDEQWRGLSMTAVLETNEPDLLLLALSDIARAKGMAQVAKDAGLGRESLYKALAPGAKPRFETVMKVARALGVKL